MSIDCGGTGNYTDSTTGLTWISDADFIKHGNVAKISTSDENGQQYKHHRYFPADSKKYCYTLTTVQRRRYLIRATFQYGLSNKDDPYPIFQLYLDSTKWSDITITVPSRVYIEEIIIRAPSTSIDVCLCCASTGYPFISTLELRPLNASVYATDFEDEFFLRVSARVNFGALSKDAIRYAHFKGIDSGVFVSAIYRTLCRKMREKLLVTESPWFFSKIKYRGLKCLPCHQSQYSNKQYHKQSFTKYAHTHRNYAEVGKKKKLHISPSQYM